MLKYVDIDEEGVVRRVRKNDLGPDLFAGTTATLTNPGTVGTVVRPSPVGSPCTGRAWVLFHHP